MPSFLNENNTPIYSDNSDILDLDPRRQLGAAGVKSSKANEPPIRKNSTHASATHEPYDETSNSSIHDSDVSDAAPMTSNGNITRPTSMSSLPNGKSVSGAASLHDDAVRENPQRLPNGSTSLPDRTVYRQPQAQAKPMTNGMQQHADEHLDKSSAVVPPISSTPAAQTSPDKTPRRSHDQNRPPLQTIPSEDSAARSEPLFPASSPTETPKSRPSPHRLSSPPVYNPSASAAAASQSSQHLQPPHPGSTLKQRHTLEVPKLPSAGRTSKDWTDVAQASGRFSPTVASGTRRPSLSLARRTTRSMQSDAPRDEIVPDEDAQRWAEAYRQKRASKRKRKEEEDDDRVLVGTKVDESHSNWVMAYNMLTGIRVSVSRTNAKLDRELNDSDFDVKQKSTFDM